MYDDIVNTNHVDALYLMTSQSAPYCWLQIGENVASSIFGLKMELGLLICEEVELAA